MYNAYWQLNSRPFENCIRRAVLLSERSAQGACSSCAMRSRIARGALLAGGAGSGKTC